MKWKNKQDKRKWSGTRTGAGSGTITAMRAESRMGKGTEKWTRSRTVTQTSMAAGTKRTKRSGNEKILTIFNFFYKILKS